MRMQMVQEIQGMHRDRGCHDGMDRMDEDG